MRLLRLLIQIQNIKEKNNERNFSNIHPKIVER